MREMTWNAVLRRHLPVLVMVLLCSGPLALGCSGEPPASTTGSSSGTGGSGGSGGTGSAQATPGTELVSGGDVVKSSKYKMVITFGGSSPGMGTMQSSKQRMRTGLIGVTEGTK